MPDTFLMPDHALAFDPIEFQFTLQWGFENVRSPSPANSDFFMTGDDGKVRHMQLADIPLSRFGLAVAGRYRDDTRKYSSFMWRWLALQKLIESGALDDRFYQPGAKRGEGAWLNDCVVGLAATFPLNKRGDFDRRGFLAALEQTL
jgi:hypothetical protein